MMHFSSLLLLLLPLPIIAEQGWKRCNNQTSYTAGNAREVTNFDPSDPESVVVFFFASKVRHDDRWKETLPEDYQQHEELMRALRDYESWRFHGFNLVNKQRLSKDEMYISIYFRVKVGTDFDSGTDQVSLVMVDGRWVIVDLPT